MSKYPKSVTFSVKFSYIQWNLFKKLLVVHHKEEKMLKIALLFSWIAFLIIVILLDLTEKSNGVEYLLISQTWRGKLVDFKDKGRNCELPQT